MYDVRQIRPAVIVEDAAKTRSSAVACVIATRLILYAVYRMLTVRRIKRTGRREHITPVLAAMHWLPVGRLVEFKRATADHAQDSAWPRAVESVR